MSVIPGSFRRSYDNIRPEFELLKNFAQPLLQEISDKFEGTYSGRIKSPDSVLSKVEFTGDGISRIGDIKDFFAAVIAVPSINLFVEIQTEVRSKFEVCSIKTQWKKNPREFVYDDLHMILSLKDNALIRDKKVLDIKFELQIKTLLQLQWWRLEHDIIYKANRRSWEKSRIFGQIRAMFELADRMLAKIDEVARIQPCEQYEEYININNMAEFLETIWPDLDNPPWYDLVRTAETVIKFMELANCDIKQFTVLMTESNNRALPSARTLTPPQVVLIVLFRHMPSVILGNLKANKLLITDEMCDFEPSLKNFPIANRIIL